MKTIEERILEELQKINEKLESLVYFQDNWDNRWRNQNLINQTISTQEVPNSFSRY